MIYNVSSMQRSEVTRTEVARPTSLRSVVDAMVLAACIKSRMSMVAPGSGNAKNFAPQCRTSTFVVSYRGKINIAVSL